MLEDETATTMKKFKLYYHTYNPAERKFIVGLATSKDGVRWKKVYDDILS